jgi:integrase
LCVLRWEHIDWQRCVAVLPWDEHKTGRRTRRPRTIALVPVMMRLLAWLKRQRPAVPTAALLAGVLARGPLPLKEVVRRMRALGASYRMMFKARLRLGVRKRPVGKGAKRHLVYELPGGGVPALAVCPQGAGHIFVNARGRPWDRTSLALRMVRLREKAGLREDCRLYGLRHRFATEAVRRGVNLKTLAELLGHTSTRMTEHYVHLGGDLTHLAEAVQRVAEGGD